MKVTNEMRARWLLLPDSYVAPLFLKGNLGWYAARKNDRCFHAETKIKAINRAVIHSLANPASAHE